MDELPAIVTRLLGLDRDSARSAVGALVTILASGLPPERSKDLIPEHLEPLVGGDLPASFVNRLQELGIEIERIQPFVSLVLNYLRQTQGLPVVDEALDGVPELRRLETRAWLDLESDPT